MSNSVSRSKQSDVKYKRVQTRVKGASNSDSSVYKSSAEGSLPSKGSKGSSLYSSSDEYFSCDPCSSTGDHVEAQGYCTNCEEYLCDICYRSHSKSKASKSHTLRDKDAMPKRSQVPIKLCDQCKTVGEDKEVVGYCTYCKVYLCSSCYKGHSKSKSSREHMLVDKESLSGEDFDQAVMGSLTALNIDTIDSGACNEEYTFIRDINVKADTDKIDCYISGMTLISNNKLVLCDNDNNCLKLVDIESNTLQDVLVLQAKPEGITTISDSQVAVVPRNKYQIVIISIIRGLVVDKIVKTNGVCVAVQFANEKFYVSFTEPVKFQILQPTGAIIKTIKPDSEVLKHCILPCYISISADESIVYVSDWKTNKVFSMDMDGNMIAMYQDELQKPDAITVSPSGIVYLCYGEQHIVYKMTSDLKEATVILGPGDGLFSPQAIFLNIDKHHFYISSGNADNKYGNFIKVYGWK